MKERTTISRKQYNGMRMSQSDVEQHCSTPLRRPTPASHTQCLPQRPQSAASGNEQKTKGKRRRERKDEHRERNPKRGESKKTRRKDAMKVKNKQETIRIIRTQKTKGVLCPTRGPERGTRLRPPTTASHDTHVPPWPRNAAQSCRPCPLRCQLRRPTTP